MSKARFKRLSWNRKFFLVILKKSMPFAVLVLLMSVYNRVDTVYLERLIGGAEGERQVGIYAQGFRLLDAVNQFAWLTAVLLLPIYSRMLKMKLDVSEMIRLPFALLFSAAVIMVSASFFYSHEIIDWLYPRGEGEDPALYAMQLAQSSRVFGILMFGFLGSVTMYVFSTLLTANGNLKQLNLVALSGIGLNMAVNMLLIPKYMATGAAVASLCTQLFTATAYLLVTQYKFRFRVNYRFIFTLALYALLVTGISIISKNLPLPWLAGFGIMLALSLLTAMLLKLINLVEIYHLIKEKTRV
jgi:O-antigen/teichoic acid export membrane protein